MNQELEEHQELAQINKNKPGYHYQGVDYYTLFELSNAVRNFNETRVNYDSISVLVRDLIKNMRLNLVDMCTFEDRITNKELRDILDKAFYYILATASMKKERKE